MENPEQDKNVQFFPFHALNEFMRDDYRLSVLQNVFGELKSLPAQYGKPVNQIVQHTVKVQGFRKSSQAPAFLKAKSSATTFQQNPEFVARILAAWAELHPELRQQVFDLLKERQWDILPIEADRSRMPGFYTDKWKKDETFEALNQAFDEKYPESTSVKDDDVSLMIVWISLCLPFSEETGVDTGDQPEA